MPVRTLLAVAAALASMTMAAPAKAQSAAPAPGSTTAIPEKVAPASPPQTDLSTKGGTLSDKLSDTNGVIHPQGTVDPKITKPAPATGTMPVIRPPGSPGGATDVQPK